MASERELRASMAATVLAGILAGPSDSQLCSEARASGNVREAAQRALLYADAILSAVQGSEEADHG